MQYIVGYIEDLDKIMEECNVSTRDTALICIDSSRLFQMRNKFLDFKLFLHSNIPIYSQRQYENLVSNLELIPSNERIYPFTYGDYTKLKTFAKEVKETQIRNVLVLDKEYLDRAITIVYIIMYFLDDYEHMELINRDELNQNILSEFSIIECRETNNC